MTAPPRVRKLFLALAILSVIFAGTACRPECQYCPSPVVVPTPVPPTPPPVVNNPTPAPTPRPTPTPTPAPPVTQPPAPAPSPVPVACVYQMQQTPQHYPYVGGNGGASVTTNLPDCPWTAVPSASWIIITSNPNGRGNGDYTYAVAANNGPPRSGYITAGGKVLPITQDGAPAPSPNPTPTPGPTPTPTPPAPTCQYLTQNTPQQFTYQGGNGGFSVTTNIQTCTWTAVSNAFWIGIDSGSSGTGNGEVRYTVAGNGGPARTGTISVAGRIVTIVQSGQ